MKSNKILLIGSDIDEEQSIINYLKNIGNSVLGVIQKELVKSTLLRDKFDLIILDLKSRKFKISYISELKEYTEAPIMVLSNERLNKKQNNKDRDAEVKAINLGADEYLYRPLNFEILGTKIKKIINSYNGETEK